MKGVYREKELMSPRATAGPKIKAMRHHDIPIAPTGTQRGPLLCSFTSSYHTWQFSDVLTSYLIVILFCLRGLKCTQVEDRDGAQAGARAAPQPGVAARQPAHVTDTTSAVWRCVCSPFETFRGRCSARVSARAVYVHAPAH
jgi:hypothetical protein